LIYRYEGLGVKEIRDFLDNNHPHVYAYLPEPSLELPKIPKQWIANVCATVLEDQFTDWVKHQINTRHNKVADKKDIMIQMDPQMAKIFHNSIAVSSKYPSTLILLTHRETYSYQGSVCQLAPEGEQAKKNEAADRRRETG